MTVPPSPRDRIHCRSDRVEREPGNTTRLAEATSAGSAVTRTETPGSAASASTSVVFEIRGNRTTATVNVSEVPRLGALANHPELAS